MKSSLTRRLLVALVAAMFVFGLVTWAAALPAKGTKAPGFRLTSVDGKSVSLDQICKDPKNRSRNRVVLLAFGATWCPYCVVETAQLQKLHRKYASKGVAIVGIEIDKGGASDVKPFVRQKKLTYPILLDPTNEVARKYGVRPIPVTILIDRDGVVRSTHLGFADGMEKDFEREIQSLLAEKPAKG